MSAQQNEILTAQAKNTNPGSPKQISVGATISIIASRTGTLHTISVGNNSSPSLTAYDNASGASGTILAMIDPGARGSYVYDVSYVNGCTVYLAAGNAPAIVVSAR